MSTRGTIPFCLLGWSAWTETVSSPDDWRAWAGDSPSNVSAALDCLPAGELPMMMRRRATALGRNALAAAMGLPRLNDARYVLSSRHGELDRTSSILTSLAQNEPVSPADFSMSVHHGLVGLLSIAAKNMNGHSAVSAGSESFCYGVLEAVSCTVENPDQPVILVHYDETPGDVFARLLPRSENNAPIVAALCIGAAGEADGVAMTMKMSARGEEAVSGSHVLDFLRFVLSGKDTVRSPGNRMTWEWMRG